MLKNLFNKSLLGIGILIWWLTLSIKVNAANPCAGLTNPIPCENSQPGNPNSEWSVPEGGDTSIQGFATAISVNIGETEQFKVKTDSSSYVIDIYRLGYYAGLGARKIATLSPAVALPQTQPPCLSDSATRLLDCGNWGVSASWSVPSDAISGIYLAKLTRRDGGLGASHMIFIVRDDNRHADLLFQTSDTTWQAYNYYGGHSLYGTLSIDDRGRKVSYNRPFITGGPNQEHSWVFNAEYPMLRWLERNGYNLSYFTGVDSAQRGGEILKHKIFLSVGHDEYWSGEQRTNVEAARNAGVNLAFFSGNEIFWKTRWENSIDGTSTPFKTLVAYKETFDGAKTDPSPLWTGTWRDPRFSPPADGGRPENALSGTFYSVNFERTDSLQVPYQFSRLRLWRNTSIATLSPGGVAVLPAGTLGHEWDEDLDNGFRPTGLIKLSQATYSVPLYVQNYGASYAPGTATHSSTLYKYSSGAWVFGAGTVQWSWGLDSNHARGNNPPDLRLQQATVNLFADMGVQPSSLQSDLTSAAKSTDNHAPTTSITSPAANSSFTTGSNVTFSGTAADIGGVVAGVEVSIDNGTSWHPASGTNSWSYTTSFSQTGPATIQARAIDDSLNIGPNTSITITLGNSICCSIWSNAPPPNVAVWNQGTPLELGVKFRSTTGGKITGIRFYKPSGDSSTHTVNLWANSGTNLATTQSSAESASGWQLVMLPTAVTISSNTTYVASYFSSSGLLSYTSAYFLSSGVDNPPLQALKNGQDGPNGIYQTSPTSTFPTSTINANNYWVDVIFDNSAQPSPTPTPFPTPTPTPTANPTPSPTPIVLKSIWSNATPPEVRTWDEKTPLELGVKFRATIGGKIRGIRFFKPQGDNSNHTVNLWTIAGTNLASAASAAENASGWQSVMFASPISISANTTYIASYFSSSGLLSYNSTFFATSGVINPPLEALKNGQDGPNGVYKENPTSTFPSNTFNSNNYWVDVLFE